MSYQLKSETLSYEYMLQAYREIGNKQMVRQLEAAPATMTIPLPASYMKVRDKAMHGLGVGTTHGMRSVITGSSWRPGYAGVHIRRKARHMARKVF